MDVIEKTHCRKRLGKRIRGATTFAFAGCCLVAAAAAAVDVSCRVVPNYGLRRASAERRRLQQDYYRRLASSQSQRRQMGESDTVRAGDAMVILGGRGSDNGDLQRRRLPASTHKKGRTRSSYDQANSHKKGNKDEDETSRDFILLGGQSDHRVSSAEDDSPAQSHVTHAESDQGGYDDDPERSDLSLATNLRRFTRRGGVGYALPPSKRYPYMCSLQLEGHAPSGRYDMHMCGGILIAPDLVLAPAHCANYSPPGTDETYQAFNGIEIGKVDLSDEGVPFDPYSLETYKLYYENLVPEKLYLHPHFNEDTYENDVMIAKVFGMSRFPPARLSRDYVQDGERVTVLGWGADSAASAKKYSDHLRTASIDIMSNRECRKVDVQVKDPNTEQISRMSLRDHVYEDMACGRQTGQRNICYGDAGGAAIWPGDDFDSDKIVGMLSWGYGCVNHDYPAVISRVSDHYQWIRNTVCKESSDPPNGFGCPKKMTALSGGPTETVTLRIKMDMMSIETGFVVEVRDTREIVAQRQTGHYKNERYGNEIVLETMDLPRDECFRLIMLDSFGDGHCCDMGGGKAEVFRGNDVGYYTGDRLVSVDGNFEFDSSAEFCTGRRQPSHIPANEVQDMTNHHSKATPPPSPKYISPYEPRPPSPAGQTTPRPTRRRPQQPSPAAPSFSHIDAGGGSEESGSGESKEDSSSHNGDGGGSVGASEPENSQGGWSGPVTNPEFQYCSQFCSSSSHGMLCGNYECVQVTDDSQESQGGTAGNGHGGDEEKQNLEEEFQEEEGGDVPLNALVSDEFYEEDSEFFLTVQIQFDENPEEISWVLYDLTKNEVKVFVDFEEYPKDQFANELLEILITIDGTEGGEKQYAFTVYDKSSNGLCCSHGYGHYKLFLGDPYEDKLELLGDDEFDFSSSYYFTLFEGEEPIAKLEELNTPSPTPMPSPKPTRTKGPSRHPTPHPTGHPTWRRTPRPTVPPTWTPTTPRPTNPWEMRRPEDTDAIGSRWNIRSNTPPGVFNDVGGDQEYYRFNADSSLHNGAQSRCLSLLANGVLFVAGVMLVYALIK